MNDRDQKKLETIHSILGQHEVDIVKEVRRRLDDKSSRFTNDLLEALGQWSLDSSDEDITNDEYCHKCVQGLLDISTHQLSMWVFSFFFGAEIEILQDVNVLEYLTRTLNLYHYKEPDEYFQSAQNMVFDKYHASFHDTLWKNSRLYIDERREEISPDSFTPYAPIIKKTRRLKPEEFMTVARPQKTLPQ